MKVFVCVDDNDGMLFNNRRQSRDQKVVEKIREMVGDGKLWIKEFSKTLFDENVIVDEALLEHAGKEDYCFVENEPLSLHEEEIDELYVFKWNRIYPADFMLDIHLEEMYAKIRTEEFVGNSHDKITLEVWKR